jgi:hypothetical protein
MTLVVTSASAQGITVVGDRAVTRQSKSGVEILKSKKVWYAREANVALAFWGNANLPGGQSLEDWASRFVTSISETDSVSSVCERLVSKLNPALESLGMSWPSLRRGVHVSGYENDVPVIFHVHTGDPKVFHHSLEVHRDYPDIYGGGLARYRQLLADGGLAQLRNGYYELFVTLAQAAFDAREALSTILGVPVPAPSLPGQAAFDEAIVRLSAGMLKSAQLPQHVGEDLDVIAFTSKGLVRL